MTTALGVPFWTVDGNAVYRVGERCSGFFRWFDSIFIHTKRLTRWQLPKLLKIAKIAKIAGHRVR